MAAIPEFSLNTLEQVARVLGEEATGSQLTNIFRQCSIQDAVGEGVTKWRRVFHSLDERQKKDRCGNNVAVFIHAVMEPVRFDNKGMFETARTSLNAKLAYDGLYLGEDGKLSKVPPASTMSEAEARAKTLQSKLQGRLIHPEVVKYCRAELLEDNYFHAIFEATKGVAQYIRDRTGLCSDGAQLVDDVFSIKAPVLAFNSLRTETEQSEHKGFTNLLKGFFGAVRNPHAHKPKVMWEGEDDAADYLTLASLLMRKLEQAVIVPCASRT